jgi:hypothetical protein
MKFMFRTLAATALVVLAGGVSLGATASSSSIGKKPAATFRQGHPEVPIVGRPVPGAPNAGVVHTPTAAAAQKKAGAAATPEKGGAAAAAQKEAAPAGSMPTQKAPAGAMPTQKASAVGATAAIPAARSPAALSKTSAVPIIRPPAAAAHEGVLSGTGVKHPPSSLATLGGAEKPGKGTASLSGTHMLPKTR